MKPGVCACISTHSRPLRPGLKISMGTRRCQVGLSCPMVCSHLLLLTWFSSPCEFCCQLSDDVLVTAKCLSAFKRPSPLRIWLKPGTPESYTLNVYISLQEFEEVLIRSFSKSAQNEFGLLKMCYFCTWSRCMWKDTIFNSFTYWLIFQEHLKW